MVSANKGRFPWWAAPLGFRWFAPALLFTLFVGVLGSSTFSWLRGTTSAPGRRLAVLWIVGLIGATLLAIGWRALLKSADRRLGHS
jgi:hypothetical protein